MNLNLSRQNQSLLMKRRLRLIERATAPELHVMALLQQAGERFLFQKGFFTSIRFFFVDFYLPKRKKLCLEIDGGYHLTRTHEDRERDRFLSEVRGFRVVRITNEAALALTPSTLSRIIVPPGTPWQEALPVRET